MMKVEEKNLFVPALDEIANALQTGLKKNFAECSVEVVECPDLTEESWNVSAAGLCGKPIIGEVGGVGYLMPLIQRDKIYSFNDISKAVGYEGLIIGAGAGPHQFLKVNSEMIANIKTGENMKNSCRIAKLDQNSCCELTELNKDKIGFAVLMNYFTCEGKKGPVLKISAKKRTGDKDFVGCLRSAIVDFYKDEPIGLGGVFKLKAGSAKIHVMPDFSSCPLNSDAKVENWLKFFEMSAPMVFMSVSLSRDPGLSFRLEHTHGHGKTEGGHYHYDVTPDIVEYEGYFNVAEKIVRIDKPAIHVPMK